MPTTPGVDPQLRDLLHLTLAPGLGPVLIGRLLEAFASPEHVLRASAAQLEKVRGIGGAKSVTFVKGLREAGAKVDGELELAKRLGVRLVPRSSEEYPALLKGLPDAPPLLYVRGRLRSGDMDRYPVAIVGSRNATAYGIEQAERFAGVLARSGLAIVSGGARGIDTAAHRGALRSGGRTIAVLGCGLAECYPPENRELFDRIVAGDGDSGGAIVSELPMRTAPDRDNFPARNRLISGISLGVIVIEAGKRSGSLITARIAIDEHNREVMAVPGRVDSPASAGTLELIKQGGAALVTEPGDVLQILETPARHSFRGSHGAQYTDPNRDDALFSDPELSPGGGTTSIPATMGLSPQQEAILGALTQPRTLDDVARETGLTPGALRTELTMLEIQRRVVRRGGFLSRS